MSRAVDPRLLRAVPSLRSYLGLLTLCQVISAILIVGQALLLASSVTTVFVGHDFGEPLATRLAGLAAVGVARAGVAALLEYAATRSSVRVRADLRRQTLEAIVRLGPLWAQRQAAGHTANAVGPGLDALDGYVSRALPAVVGATVIPAAALVAITATDWQSGVLLLIMVPLVPLFMALVGISTKRRVQRQYLLLSRLAGQFLDLLRGLTTLRIYGQAERQQRTLHEASERYRHETMSALRITFLSALVLDLVAALSVAVIAVDIGLRLDSGHISFLTALVVLFLAPELFAPLRAMGAQFHANQQGATASAACLDLIAEAPPIAPRGGEQSVLATGGVALNAVSVRYDDRDVAALSGVDLNLQAGELAVLTGPSGAGKSTVLACLLGFVTPRSGSVLVGIDGVLDELDSANAQQWRRNVAWLPQRPSPTQASVGAEVRLGDPDASDLDVARACVQCQTPPPSTTLGEDGRWVSAGQRRRIALARAVLRARSVYAAGGVPLVLLDEPSEDLDDATEQVVAHVITSMQGWATVVIATHSDVLGELAQRRIVLGNGRVVEDRRQRPARLSDTPEWQQADNQPVAQDRPTTAAAALRMRVIARTHGVRGKLARAAALAALAGLSGLALTATSTWLISRAAQHPNVQALAIGVVGVRTFAIARALLRYAERLSSHDAALRLLSGLREQVFAGLRPLGAAALGGYARGDLLRRFVGDVDGVQDGLIRTFIPLLGGAATCLGATIVAAALDPDAGAILAGALVIAGGVLPWLSIRAARHSRAAASLIGERDTASAALVEALPELVAFAATTAAVENISRVDLAIARIARRLAATAAAGTLVAGFSSALALPAIMFAGAAAVRSGRLPVVDLAVVAVCVLAGFEAMTPLPAAMTAWSGCQAGLRRVAAILGAPAAVPAPPSYRAVPDGELGLRAVTVALAPAPGAATILHGIDVALQPGERIAIIGPSGSGKSTFLSAVLRQLPLSTGTLELTGRNASADISAITDEDLPAAVAGSLQGDHVFDATLRDNLRVVRPETSDAELDEVARRAGLGGFVAELPDGWSTRSGPDGAALSGGQRQRLLLARALLADPHILVLDEPTAHLDADIEEAILSELLDATAGRTVLLSTHRTLPRAKVDAVARIAAGRLLYEKPAASRG